MTVLGCGASAGVPLIGCGCAVCRSSHPKNKRLRVSVLVEDSGRKVLIDTSPDLREQCLRYGITAVDAIVYTHDHADHTHGVDEVRAFNHHSGREMPIYGDRQTIAMLRQRFPYAFIQPKPEISWIRPCLIPHEIELGKAFSAGEMTFLPFAQKHGKLPTVGLRVGNFAYSTDVNALDDDAFDALRGIDIWVVDCLRYAPSYSHAHLALTLEWIRRAQPRLAVLTHMAHDFDYDTLAGELPENAVPAYDGMVLELRK